MERRPWEEAAAKEARTNAWRDAECKALEDAIYSYGVGAAGDCRRACINSGVARPFAEVSATAVTLVSMIERVGRVCKARFDELEHAGPVERCSVCTSQKKGRCGTETAPRACLKLPAEVANAMDDAEDGVGAVPIGMDRATWEATVEVCEEVLEERKEDCPAAAALSLGRVNTWKRLASGWARATKCLKERAALAAAIEDVDATAALDAESAAEAEAAAAVAAAAAAADDDDDDAEMDVGKEEVEEDKEEEEEEEDKSKKKKRPLTAFLLYCAEARGALEPGLTAPEQAKLLGAQWWGRIHSHAPRHVYLRTAHVYTCYSCFPHHCIDSSHLLL